MKMNTKPKFVYGIKGKLISAVCMLLVAMIMVVSSTYAWFTLSTAPEVTGIQTAVGANGALEMALLGNTGSMPGETQVGDGTGDDWTVKNLTWGNLVDLSNPAYGLDNVVLYPSVLNKGTDGKIASSGILKIPSYGEDGRPDVLQSNTFTGTYDNAAFKVNNNYGVRAIGASSSMTERQIAYRNYMGTAKDNTSGATASIAQLLRDNGNGLASAAMKIAMNGDKAKFTQADVTMIGTILAGLETSLGKVETALLNYIYATVASQKAQETLTDDEWALVDADLKWKTVNDVKTAKTLADLVTAEFYVPAATEGGSEQVLTKVGDKFYTEYTNETTNTPYDGDVSKIKARNVKVTVTGVEGGIALIGAFPDAYATYTALGTKIAAAKTALNSIASDTKVTVTVEGVSQEQDGYTNSAFSPVFTHLVDASKVTINGMSMSAAKENLLSLISGGVNVQMPSGSGIFADFADLCGNYSAPVTVAGEDLDVGITVSGNMSATLITTSTVTPAYLARVNTQATTAGSPDRPAIDQGSTTDATLSEFYGYIIDLAFRTNAAGSSLRLQTEAIDRIYKDNAADSVTMGGGSSMTFETSDPSFTADQMAELMSALRIVFFNTETREIYVEARLTDFEVNGGEVTGYMYVVEEVDEYYVVEGETEIILTKHGEIYYTSYTDATTNTPYDGDIDKIQHRTIKYKAQEEADITTLDQGIAKKVSVLVYLDGNIVDNSKVPTKGNLTGTMNLQFSSSADLKPMDYGEYQNPTNP